MGWRFRFVFVLLWKIRNPSSEGSCIIQLFDNDFKNHGNCEQDHWKTIRDEIKTDALFEQEALNNPAWSKAGTVAYQCFDEARENYGSARKICQRYGGRLAAAVLRDPDAVRNIIASNCWKMAWVGFDKLAANSIWKWSDGVTMSNVTTQWYPNEPNNYRRTEKCGQIKSAASGKIYLNDQECSDRNNFICEVSK